MSHASPRAFRAQPATADFDEEIPVSRHRAAIHPPAVPQNERETVAPPSTTTSTIPAPGFEEEVSFAPHTLRSPPPPADLAEMTRTIEPPGTSGIRDLGTDEEVSSGPVTERTFEEA